MDDSNRTLGNASLALGIASASLVFGIGLCALTGLQQGWIAVAGVPLFVCGASSAFLGFIGAVLGAAGIVSSPKSRATSAVGLILGLVGACLFFAIMSNIG